MAAWTSWSSDTSASNAVRYYRTTNCTSTTSDDWEWIGMSPGSGIPSKIPAGQRTIELPDGAKLVLDDKGNYHIDDSDAQVIYQANRVRDFSPHLNASDMVADFVRYVGDLGVRKSDVLGLPLHLFISWLVIQAAERDGDAIPADVLPVDQDPVLVAARRPRCLRCGRFVKQLHHQCRFPFCSPEHGAEYLSQKNQIIVA